AVDLLHEVDDRGRRVGAAAPDRLRVDDPGETARACDGGEDRPRLDDVGLVLDEKAAGERVRLGAGHARVALGGRQRAGQALALRGAGGRAEGLRAHAEPAGVMVDQDQRLARVGRGMATWRHLYALARVSGAADSAAAGCSRRTRRASHRERASATRSSKYSRSVATKRRARSFTSYQAERPRTATSRNESKEPRSTQPVATPATKTARSLISSSK